MGKTEEIIYKGTETANNVKKNAQPISNHENANQDTIYHLHLSV